jgi:purine-binding chemotaxis protein CheW
MEASRSAIVLSPADRVETLLFELAGQRFAVPLSGVIELTRACALQSLPNAPGLVLGVLNLRGAIVPVLDLRRRFGLPETALDVSDCFVFAQVAERRVALRVDRLLGIESLVAIPISEAPNLPVSLEYLSGVAAVADGVVLIYDLSTFLSEAEAALLNDALPLTPHPSEHRP